MAGDRAGLDVDLRDLGPGVAVEMLEDTRVGEGPLREPHRHGHHEILWLRAGSGEQRVDGEPMPVRPGTLTVVGRGQVHQFRHAHGLHGAVVRFADEALSSGGRRIAAGWLLGARGGRIVPVPPHERPRVQAVVEALHAESRRPPDPHSAELLRDLLSVLLHWIERWYDASRAERPEAADADVALHRRFAELLERDFARHHDAAHYADVLAVPPAALSRTLTRLTGQATKELVLERVMLEAARLLRFTDLSVGEIAHRTGFRDQLYFSRAFKRHTGRPPVAYRDAIRGVA